MYIGAIPNAICQIISLTVIYITSGGSNPGITCAPLCLSSVTGSNLFVPSTICPQDQDVGLCGLVAATNVQSKSGYSQWSCTTGGYTSTSPCASPVWPGIVCSGNIVIWLNLYSLGLIGNHIAWCIYILIFEACRYYSL